MRGRLPLPKREAKCKGDKYAWTLATFILWPVYGPLRNPAWDPGAHGRIRLLCVVGKVRVSRSLATSTVLGGECPILAGRRVGGHPPGLGWPWQPAALALSVDTYGRTGRVASGLAGWGRSVLRGSGYTEEHGCRPSGRVP